MLQKGLIKGILFDYGGTLDTGATHWFHVFKDGYHFAGLDVKEELLRDAYIFGEREVSKAGIIQKEDSFRSVLEKKMAFQFSYILTMDPILVARQEIRQKKKVVIDFCMSVVQHHTRRSRSVLDCLRQRFLLALVSNFYGNLHKVITEFDLDLFSTEIESARVGVRKPDPLIFSKSVEALAIRPEEALVVGDSFEKDIIPARSIGCQTIWFKGQAWNAQERDETIPSGTILKIEDLLQIL